MPHLVRMASQAFRSWQLEDTMSECLPSPLRAPPLPDTDILSLLFDKPPTDYSPEDVIFQDDVSTAHLTWQGLRRQLRCFGGGLRTEMKVKSGDRVMVLATHGLHYPAILYGILCAGATVVPINPALLVSDVEKYIVATGSRTIIVGHQFTATAEALKKLYPDLVIIEIVPSTNHKSKYTTFQGLLESEEHDWPRGREINRATAMICFSSGTSGLPKGCQISHANVVGNQHIHYYGTRPAQRSSRNIVLAAFPPFHAAGIWGSITNPVYRGDFQILMKSFNLQQYLDLITQYKPTELLVAPPIVLLLATIPAVDKVDFSSVRQIGVGAAPLGQELIEKCLGRLKGLGGEDVKLHQVWGMTEGVCCLTAYNYDDDESLKLGGVGFPLPHLSIKLVDTEHGNVVGPGERGEILIKGCCIFQGYLDLDNADFFTRDGFYKTGDVGVADEQGRLTIVDRIKELIKVSGYQVAPAELEGILLSHPDVDDAAVVGIPFNDNTSERPRAYLVLKPDSKLARQHQELSRKKLHAWFNAKVVKYKHLTGGIKILRAEQGQVIPKTPSGKILRRVLRDQAALEQVAVARM